MIAYQDVVEAAARIQGRVLRSPFLRMDGLARLTGAELYVKFDHLQVTGAFKERGAANRIALLSAEERQRGVVAMSAGNHAQAVARHAMLAKIKATIVMPRHTPSTKVTRTASWGAKVVLHGETLAEAAAEASRLAHDEGLFFIHPYNDPAVMAGQGTMALEMFEDVPDLDALIVATGGGGLIAGSTVVARHLRPACTVYGVEVEHYAAFAQSLAGREIKVGGPTIAEGIAVRDIGQNPLAVLKNHDVPILVVTEHAVESAIDSFVENAKQVTEGAGAVGLAAIMTFPELFRGKKVGISICGANIDPRILANTLMRCLLRDGRMLRLILEMPDRPGMLAEVSRRIGELGGNILEVAHHRLFSSPSVQDAQLEVMIEARDAAHGESIQASLAEVFVLRRL